MTCYSYVLTVLKVRAFAGASKQAATKSPPFVSCNFVKVQPARTSLLKCFRIDVSTSQTSTPLCLLIMQTVSRSSGDSLHITISFSKSSPPLVASFVKTQRPNVTAKKMTNVAVTIKRRIKVSFYQIRIILACKKPVPVQIVKKLNKLRCFQWRVFSFHIQPITFKIKLEHVKGFLQRKSTMTLLVRLNQLSLKYV